MRVEKIATQYETYYIANDGKQWRCEHLCKQYEELLADPTPLKKLKFFDGKGEPIDVFAIKEIPAFCYLVLTEEPPKYNWEVIKAIIGNRDNDESSYHLPIYSGVWYNDWSNAYNGGYGYNGWEVVESIQTLENQIKSRQEKIKLLQKISKTP